MTDHDPKDDDQENPIKLVKGRYEGPTRAAPYPMSRLAPSYSLVDSAREIEAADSTIATMTSGKLSLIAEQIRQLREKAESLLEKARNDATLHRALCNFEKKPGGIYHVYRNEDGALWFSLFGPTEWKTGAPPGYSGSYRLEADQSFTELGTAEESSREAEISALRALLVAKT